MKIYKIYCEQQTYNYDIDDYEYEYITVKYVDSIEKYCDFIKQMEDKNLILKKCESCPIHTLDKRKYNNNPNIIKDYCEDNDVEFDGNDIWCDNYESQDFIKYLYEEIKVEQ